MNESYQHQEARGRRVFNWKAVGLAALTAGVITFIMSGGAPWTTAGTMNAVMGRHFEFPLPVLAILHLLVAFVHASLIALAIYQLSLIPSLVTGVLVGMGLYAINRIMFWDYSTWQGGSPEVQAIGAHFSFGLFAAAVYRGAAVPRQIVDSDNQGNAARRPKDNSPTHEEAE